MKLKDDPKQLPDGEKESMQDFILCDRRRLKEQNRFLRQGDPKIQNRIRGHTQAARWEFSGPVRRRERIAFARLLKRVGLDPEGPYPKNLVEKYGPRIQTRRKKRSLKIPCINPTADKEVP